MYKDLLHLHEVGSPLRRFKRLGAGILATVALIPLSTSHDAPDPLMYTAAVSYDINPGAPMKKNVTDMCDDPSAADIKSVENIFNEPENPNISKGDAALAIMRRDVADKYGLTMHDFMDSFSDLKHDQEQRSGPDLPFDVYFNRVKEFSAKYGIDLELKSQDSPEAAYSSTSYAPEALEDRLAKLTVYNLARSLSKRPVEFVTYMGARKIVLAKIGDPEIGGFADTKEGHTIYVDPLKGADPDIVTHEIIHVWDGQKCGPTGMRHDRLYAAQNPLQPVYDRPNDAPSPAVATGKYIDRAAFMSFKRSIERQIRQANKNNDMLAVQALNRSIIERGRTVVAADEYGLSDEVEDKGTTGEDLLDTFHQRDVLNPETPVIENKAKVLLGRIYEDHPVLVEYLAQTSLRAD